MKEIFRLQASICKIMSSPVRMELIYALKGGERTVSELVEELGLTKSNVSQHLAILKGADMVTARREGVNIYYSISSPKIVEACRLMREVLLERLESQQLLIDKIGKD